MRGMFETIHAGSLKQAATRFFGTLTSRALRTALGIVLLSVMLYGIRLVIGAPSRGLLPTFVDSVAAGLGFVLVRG